jgi:hypothetical protein
MLLNITNRTIHSFRLINKIFLQALSKGDEDRTVYPMPKSQVLEAEKATYKIITKMPIVSKREKPLFMPLNNKHASGNEPKEYSRRDPPRDSRCLLEWSLG